MSTPEPQPNPSQGRGATRGTWSERAGAVFWAGLVVGMLLAVGGFAALSLGLGGNTTGQLILCSGLGIIFGAFGSTATVKYKGAVITGVAAIAIVLLLVVDHLIADDYVELEILGDINGAEVEIVGDENYLGAARDRKHKFIVIAKEIRTQYLTVDISVPRDSQDDGEEVYLFECIHKGEIEPYLGSGQIIQWRFDRQNAQLFDGDQQRKIADIGPCPRRADAGPPAGRRDRSRFAGLGTGVLSSALAADPVETKDLIRDLGAKSSYVRREARKSLADQGLPAVRPLLDELAAEPVSYPTRLGVVVALTEMLRVNKDRRRELSALMTGADLKRLVAASADKDRTIRIYASEFLYDLGDVRVTPAVFDRLETADDDGRYNLLLILEGVYPYLDDAGRSEVDQLLSEMRPSLGPKTRQLVGRFVPEPAAESAAEPASDSAAAPAAQAPRYWVIVGSYTDRSRAQAHAKRINAESDSLGAFVGLRTPNNPYYPVIVGGYVPRAQAEALVEAALKLKSVREYGSAPYLSAYADRRS